MPSRCELGFRSFSEINDSVWWKLDRWVCEISCHDSLYSERNPTIEGANFYPMSSALLLICIEIANGRISASVCLTGWAKFEFLTRQRNNSAGGFVDKFHPITYYESMTVWVRIQWHKMTICDCKRIDIVTTYRLLWPFSHGAVIVTISDKHCTSEYGLGNVTILEGGEFV